MPYGALFQGIKEEEYRRMMVCFRAKEKGVRIRGGDLYLRGRSPAHRPVVKR